MFRERFEAVVAALQAHPEVVVFGAALPDPASAQDLAAAEAFLGQPLPEAMREFYAAHNGAYLEWGLRGRDYTQVGCFSYPGDYGTPPGCVNILPIADAMSASWQSEYHVNDIRPEQQERIFGQVPEDIPVGAVCIDNFSMFYHGDLLLGPEPVMIVSTDHGADMDASDWTSFATYLDMTLALYGANRYTLGIGIGWSRKSQRVEQWTEKLSLDEVLAKVREDES